MSCAARRHFRLSFALIALMGAGCARTVSVPPPEAPVETPPEAAIQEPVSSYYYYSEAQIALKQRDVQKALAYLQAAVEVDPDSTFLRKELAAILVRVRQPQAAFDQIEAVLSRTPDDVDAWLVSGSIRQMLGHPLPELVETYETVLELDPERKSPYLALGNFYLALKQPEKARETYTRLIQLDPDHYAGYYYMAQLEELAGNLPEARKALEKVAELEPNLPDPRLALVRMLQDETLKGPKIEVTHGDTLDAILIRHHGRTAKHLRDLVVRENASLRDPDALEIGMALWIPPNPKNKGIREIRNRYASLFRKWPTHAESILHHALFLRRIGLPDAARADFQRLANDPEQLEQARKILLKDYLEPRHPEPARFLLEQIVDVAGEPAPFLLLTGLAEEELQHPDAAISAYSRIAPEHALFPRAAIRMALLLESGNQTDRSLQILKRANTEHPESLPVLITTAALLERQGNHEAAIETIRACVALDPDNSQHYYSLSVLLDQIGDRAGAIREMENVVRLSPDDASALNNLGYMLAEANTRLDEAEEMIRKALILKPDTPSYLDSLGWVYYQKAAYDLALPWLKKAAHLLPDDPAIQDHLGDTYRKLGRIEDARKAYERSFELAPSPDVKRKLDSLP